MGIADGAFVNYAVRIQFFWFLNFIAVFPSPGSNLVIDLY